MWRRKEKNDDEEEDLSTGIDVDDFAGLKKADPSSFRFFNIDADDNDDYNVDDNDDNVNDDDNWEGPSALALRE